MRQRHLPSSVTSQLEEIPTVQFTNAKALLREINRVSGDFLVVTNVSPIDFTHILEWISKRRRGIRFRRYHASTGILIITIPTGLHEALHTCIYNAFRDQLVKKNRERSWRSRGKTTFRGENGDVGEGDSTGGPRPGRTGCKDWPTLVVEAGDSEPLGELHKDMRWWFSTSSHQVKIVLLVKFDYVRREILIEKWEEEQPPRLGATTTRQAATAFEPVLRQRVTIARDVATSPVSYHVTRTALVLSFRLLYLRNPGPQEGDFIISIPMLEIFAEDVRLDVLG
ncbi:hypothetical protein F4819DRAFT_237364 [Hypoxylon fuscum]|nr:hypothetical protein F4819DRAFT_237364 [Hypoxylon fuscum]